MEYLSASPTIQLVKKFEAYPISDKFRLWYDGLTSEQRHQYEYLRRFLNGDTTLNSPNFPIGRRYLGEIEKGRLIEDHVDKNPIRPTFALIYSLNISMPTKHPWPDGMASDIYMPMGDIYTSNLLHWLALHGIDASDRVFSLIEGITRPDLYKKALTGDHTKFSILTQDTILSDTLSGTHPQDIVKLIGDKVINAIVSGKGGGIPEDMLANG